MTTPHFVKDFREAAPYIDYLRGKTLVIGIASSMLESPVLHSLAADIHLLASLGVKIVLVHGSRRQISALSEASGITPQYHGGRRITDEATLTRAKQACGMIRFDIEAALAVGIAHSPQRGKRLRLACGNFVSARPFGIIDGIDMGYTGRVRKIDVEAIQQRLNDGAVALISPLGSSLSGKTFNLSMADIAESAAIALKAEKLIFVVEQEGILDEEGLLIPNLSANEARNLLESDRIQPNQRRLVQSALTAVENQIQRVHVLSGLEDGSLMSELFTREGTGTSFSQAPFMSIRQAGSSDIADIISLVRPLEEAGILLKRSREYLENHIREFFVLEHDRQIYGCVALKIFETEQAAELACLVVSPNAQDGGYGELLLEHVIKETRARKLHSLFALSTHTGDWFIERGFQTALPDELPNARRQEYDESKRHSKIFMMPLE